ncbi:hypothetical protein oki184_17890 [Helicobacter pylori]
METVKYKKYNGQAAQRFFKVYKYLFVEDAYRELTPNEMMLYTLYVDEQDKKLRYNKAFKDQNQRTYMIYKDEFASRFIGCKEETLRKYKAHLEEVGLIKVDRTKKPQRIYINQKIKVNHHASTYVDSDSQETRYAFIQVPHFLLSDVYRHLTWSDILTKSLIRDRFALSIKHSKSSHDYIDGKGRVFATFPLQELSRCLHISQRKVQTCINHLKGLKLLATSRVKFMNGTGQVRNILRFYVYEPIALPVPSNNKESEKMVIVDDFNEADIIDKSVSESKPRLNEMSNNDYLPHNYTSSHTRSINTRTNDMYDMYKEREENNTLTNQTQHSNSNILNYEDYKTLHDKQKVINNLPKLIQIALTPYSLNELKEIKATILKGKASFNRDLFQSFTLEDVELDLSHVIHNLQNKRKTTNESITDLQAYLMTSVINVFKQYYNSIKPIDDTDEQLEARFDAQLKEAVHRIHKYRYPESIHDESKQVDNKTLALTPEREQKIKKGLEQFQHEIQQFDLLTDNEQISM